MQLIQAQGFGQSLLSESLLGEHSGDPLGTLVALGWIKQNELLNLAEFLQQIQRAVHEVAQKSWMKVHQKRLLYKGKIEKLVASLRSTASTHAEVLEKI